MCLLWGGVGSVGGPLLTAHNFLIIHHADISVHPLEGSLLGGGVHSGLRLPSIGPQAIRAVGDMLDLVVHPDNLAVAVEIIHLILEPLLQLLEVRPIDDDVLHR